MDELIVATDREGNTVAIPIRNILYMIEEAGWTDIALIGGAWISVNERFVDLGLAIFRSQERAEETLEGVAPTKE